MPKKKRQNKTEIKRQIAQFLANSEMSNQVSDVRPARDLPSNPLRRIEASKAISITDTWSQTTTAEIKRILILVVILMVLVAGITIFDRKFSLIEKIGHRITNNLQL